jgi:CheY-like chemotaxis protein
LEWNLLAESDQVHGDSTRLHQVFWNLLTNALKFTSSGGVVTVTACNPISGKLRIEVTDTGVGIDTELLPKVFDAFEQGTHGSSRQFGGLGLGLAIAKSILEMHGGTISAASDGRNLGARFTVELDAMPAATSHASRAKAGDSDTNSRRILRLLLVEDDETTRRVLRRLLQKSGHTVTAASSVGEALSAVHCNDYDVLISDIGLPDGTGLELMRQIRSAGKTIPGIALTGFGMDADIQNSIAAGFLTHLTKPVDLRLLEVSLCQAASNP